MKLVTRESLQAIIDRADERKKIQIVGRALVVLFNNQTKDEQRVNDTNEHNGIGFTGADGYSGCITAKTFIKRGTLLDWQLERWLKPAKSGYSRITKYHNQLNQAAIARKTAEENLQVTD